ncbi:MAG TPA: hypothetical protein VG477_03970 [Thermoanaerobaculia bacterium]|nr:hypothetical protein [Thermoanaerobaculia bacterium]
MKRFFLIPLLLASVAPALAHEGPPFPILVDQRVGPYVVSVWTDPDIGTGTFFVILEPPEGTALPAQTTVRVAVEPLDKHHAETIYEAEPQKVRQGARYFTETKFDQGGLWRVRVLLAGSEGGGELTAEVEPTPDGTIGPIALVLYALPFLAVGFLWLKAVLHRKEKAAGETIPPAASDKIADSKRS